MIEGESDARVGVRRSVLIRSRRRARCRSGSRFRRRLRLRLLRQRLTRQQLGAAGTLLRRRGGGGGGGSFSASAAVVRNLDDCFPFPAATGSKDAAS